MTASPQYPKKKKKDSNSYCTNNIDVHILGALSTWSVDMELKATGKRTWHITYIYKPTKLEENNNSKKPLIKEKIYCITELSSHTERIFFDTEKNK